MKGLALGGMLVYICAAFMVLLFVGGVFIHREPRQFSRSQAIARSMPPPKVTVELEPLPWDRPPKRIVVPKEPPIPIPVETKNESSVSESPIEPPIIPLDEHIDTNEPEEIQSIVIYPKPAPKKVVRSDPPPQVFRPRIREPQKEAVRRSETPDTRLQRELEEGRKWRRETLARWAREEAERNRQRG